jgi:hypothetical protein
MTRYNSAISTWLVLIIVIPLGGALLMAIFTKLWFAAIPIVVPIIMVVDTFRNTYYILWRRITPEIWSILQQQNQHPRHQTHREINQFSVFSGVVYFG